MVPNTVYAVHLTPNRFRLGSFMLLFVEVDVVSQVRQPAPTAQDGEDDLREEYKPENDEKEVHVLFFRPPRRASDCALAPLFQLW